MPRPIADGGVPTDERPRVDAGRGRTCWNFIKQWTASLLLCGSGIFSARAEVPATTPEYQVKAAFLFQFSRFVQWPPVAFDNEHAPLVICVLGANPFGSTLQEITADEWVYTHPLVVQQHADIATLDGCHIVFVSSGKSELGRQALRHLSGRSVLTVGDSDDFSRNGGVIGLVTVNGKVRVQVNRSSAQAAQLKISAKLLRVADLTG